MNSSVPTGEKRIGRRPSAFWASFTADSEPYKQREASCRHCHDLVRYHKKWEQARGHLMKCEPFLQHLDRLATSEHPDWFKAELEKRRQAAAKRASRGANSSVGRQQKPPQTAADNVKAPTAAETSTAMLKHSVMETPTPAILKDHSNAVKPMKKEPVKVEDCVAMHLFLTLPMEKLAEQNIESPYLSQAFQVCSREKVLADKKMLMTVLLDRCYSNLKRRVSRYLANEPVPVCLSLSASSLGRKGEVVVDYTATSLNAITNPFFLESVHLPNGGESSANVQWTAFDVSRQIESFAFPVVGCVLPCSAVENRQALEQLFPAKFFHGCMRDALLTLVHQFFDPAAAVRGNSSATTPFFPELQQFALECKDLVQFLPPSKPIYYRKPGSSKSMLHVKATRMLSVEEGFAAIIQADAFLDKEGALHQLISGTSNDNGPDGVPHTYNSADCTPMQTQLIENVRAPHFMAKLRKYLEVLRPVHKLLVDFCCDAKCGAQPLSEVYPAFNRLTDHFTSSSLLVPEEKARLQALVRQQYENVLGRAHLLANLLDPVHVGQDFPADLKVDAEDKLLCSVNAHGVARSTTETEALYVQYTAFQIAALHQKTNNADSFVFRMLKERKKSPLQYWLLDGSKWPELQAVACRVFSMSACIGSASDLFSRTGVSPQVLRDRLDLRTTEKLAYVRANTMQLQLAEGRNGGAMSLGLQDDEDADDIIAFDDIS